MQIVGIGDLTLEQLDEAIHLGGRFVFFEKCISCIAITLRQPSPVVFLPPGVWGWWHGLGYTVVSLLFGWFGLPWGIIYTPLAVATNLSGGCDVTAQVRAYLARQNALKPDGADVP